MRRRPLLVSVVVVLAVGVGSLAALGLLLVVLPWPRSLVGLTGFLGPARLPRVGPALPAPPPYTFPPGFLWGTATAAYQVESRQDSDWGAFERRVIAEGRFETLGPGKAKAGHIHDLGGYPEAVQRNKTNYDALFPQDLKRAADMKHNAYRFSIEWARLFPREEMTEPDPAALAFYDGVFRALREQHLTPSVTLFHFTTPAWLWQEHGGKRGWERSDALFHFERFVRAIAQRYGGDIAHYCTLNEPMVYLYNGYMEGTFPPNEKRGDPARLTGLMSQLLRAHVLAYRLLKEDARRRGKEVLVGLTQHTRLFSPYRDAVLLDRLTARLVAQAFIWDLTDALHTGVLKVTNTSYKDEIAGLKGAQDYLGINYYGRFYIQSELLHPTRFTVLPADPSDPAEDRNDLGWAAYPHGFYLILKQAWDRYHLPIYVLENGTADAAGGGLDDRARQRFLTDHITEMWRALHAGVDVRGYFHWSLLDNFEWAEGFEARFGLVRVDYLDSYRRTPRKSAALYTRIIESGVTADMLGQPELQSESRPERSGQ